MVPFAEAFRNQLLKKLWTKFWRRPIVELQLYG